MVIFGDSRPYVNEEYIKHLNAYLKEFKELQKKVYNDDYNELQANRYRSLKGKLLQGLYSCYMEVYDGSCCPEYRPIFVEIIKVVNKTW